MKRYFLILSILLIVISSFTMAVSVYPSLSAGKTASDFGAKTVLIIHYHRYDGNYAGWNLWVWPYRPESLAGAAYQFTGEDSYGPYAIIKFDQKYTQLGFIVRLNDWQAKDVSEDRHVVIPSSGVAEIWVVEGQYEWYTNPNDIDISPRVMGSFLNSLNKVDLYLTNPIETKDWKGMVSFTVDGKDWPIEDVEPAIAGSLSKTSYIEITLKAPLSTYDVAKPMVVEIKGFQPAIVYAYKALNDPQFYYSGQLGPIYTPAETTFKVWSPVSEWAKVLLYKTADATAPYATYDMARDAKGVWSAEVKGNLNGVYYLYEFYSYDQERITPDINCYAADMYNRKSMVVNLANTNPPNWSKTLSPSLTHRVNAIIYEVDVRDFSVDPNSGVPTQYRGKYLAFTATGTTYNGIPTGIDHLKALGITDVQIMPIQDFWNEPFDQYNWGYITYLFNVPEAQYSTDPQNPMITIEQVKEMIQSLHENGIGVIMDVVYNHTSGVGKNSPFDQTVPYYYYRVDEKGSYLNQSGVGNTIATENTMARQYIIDSLKYWVKEYHVNGFRFDLLGLFDKQTVKDIVDQLHAIDPQILLYGEPWGGWGVTPLFGKGDQKGMKVAVFNDDLRDAVIGSVFDITAKGFIEGANKDVLIQRGVVGEIPYSQVISGFTQEPGETINYVTCHDNYTLWDKISGAATNWTVEQKEDADKLANGIILTSQGIPFIAGGAEFARTKGGNGNSYDAGDAVNEFDWSRLETFQSLDEYYQGLIELRKTHPAFRMYTADQIKSSITFFPTQYKQVTQYLRMPLAFVAYEIHGSPNGDTWKNIIVIYNGENQNIKFTLPEGQWDLVVNQNQAGVDTISVLSGEIEIPSTSMYILHQ